MMKPVFWKRGGFSLVEVMIALVLLAIGMLAFAGLEVVAIRNMTFSKDYGRANTYAQQKVEEMKGMAWNSLQAGSDTLEGRFTRTWTVTTQGDMRTAQVTVNWVDTNHGTKTVTFFTDFYQNPSMP